MGELREKHIATGPFLDWDPVDAAALFLRTNRYKVESKEHGDIPDVLEVQPNEETEEPVERPSEVLTKCVATRGSKGRGWLSSNLTELHTHLTISLVGNSLVAEYVVDISGQFLRADERYFWRREFEAMKAFLTEDGDLTNIAEAEGERANELRREFMQVGAWAAFLCGVVLFVAGIIFMRS